MHRSFTPPPTRSAPLDASYSPCEIVSTPGLRLRRRATDPSHSFDHSTDPASPRRPLGILNGVSPTPCPQK
eukprot:854051-Prymnesium_polylepis.1